MILNWLDFKHGLILGYIGFFVFALFYVAYIGVFVFRLFSDNGTVHDLSENWLGFKYWLIMTVYSGVFFFGFQFLLILIDRILGIKELELGITEKLIIECFAILLVPLVVGLCSLWGMYKLYDILGIKKLIEIIIVSSFYYGIKEVLLPLAFSSLLGYIGFFVFRLFYLGYIGLFVFRLFYDSGHDLSALN
jgi:hypothetical protein